MGFPVILSGSPVFLLGPALRIASPTLGFAGPGLRFSGPALGISDARDSAFPCQGDSCRVLSWGLMLISPMRHPMSDSPAMVDVLQPSADHCFSESFSALSCASLLSILGWGGGFFRFLLSPSVSLLSSAKWHFCSLWRLLGVLPSWLRSAPLRLDVHDHQRRLCLLPHV